VPVPPPSPLGPHKSPAAATAVAWRRQRRQAPPGGFSNRHSRARSHAILPPGPRRRRHRRQPSLLADWPLASRGLGNGVPLAAAAAWVVVGGGPSKTLLKMQEAEEAAPGPPCPEAPPAASPKGATPPPSSPRIPNDSRAPYFIFLQCISVIDSLPLDGQYNSG